MAIFRKKIKVNNSYNKKLEAVMKEERTINYYLFGIPISALSYDRETDNISEEELESGLGFKFNKKD